MSETKITVGPVATGAQGAVAGSGSAWWAGSGRELSGRAPLGNSHHTKSCS